jgi:hypothetical protein
MIFMERTVAHPPPPAARVPVEYHHVVPVDRHVLQGRPAVQGHVDGHPLPAQPGRPRRGQDLVFPASQAAGDSQVTFPVTVL